MLRLLLLISFIIISSISFAEEKKEIAETEIIEALTELSNQIPQQYLSLDAVAEHNEYDEKKIIQWLSKNIQYSPSPGYQLTPENALQTASGNALEQAILLQNILIQAGFEARIAKAQLDETTAITLLKQSFIPSPANQWEFSDEISNQYLKKFAILYGQKENVLLDKYKELGKLTPWNESKLYQEAGELSKTLYSAIEKQGAWNITEEGIKPWINIAKQYYFIKYRLAQGDKWTQAHPAFVENVPTIKKSSYFTDDIASQYHQITLQVFITRQTESKKKETIAVTPVIKRSSQQLFEHQLSFVTAPSNSPEAIDKKSIELAYKSKYFTPVVDGELLENTRAFSLDGKDYAAKDIFDPTHKLFNTAYEKTKELTSTLDNLEKPQNQTDETSENMASSVLLDYYFKISWKAPNGDSREIKRIIYQKQAKQTNKSRFHDVSQRVLLAAEPAKQSPLSQLNRQFTAQISIFKLLQKARQQDFSEIQIISQINQWHKTQKDLVANNTLALSQQHNITQQFFSKIPMLSMIWERENYETDQASVMTSFDYLINAGQIVKLSGKTLQVDASATLEHGIWSTYSEALVQGMKRDKQLSRNDFPENVVSAAGQFNQATSDGQILEIISSIDQIDSLEQINSSAKILLKTELSKNPQYLYILPKVRPDKDYLAYYRVDTQTGESLGYSEFGKGAVNADHVLMVSRGIILGTYFYKLFKCSQMGDAYDSASCIVCVSIIAFLALNASRAGAEQLVRLGRVVGGFGVGLACSGHM